MEILLHNVTTWMPQNVALALLGVIFGFLLLKSKKSPFRIIFFVLWFLFVPNTIYLLTDLQYFPEQVVKLEFPYQVILAGQYLLIFILGITTFLLGLYPLEKILKDLKIKDRNIHKVALIIMSFLISFAVALGKIQRVSSWEVFTNPKGIITGVLATYNSSEVMTFVILFGILSSALYFSFKRIFKFT